MLCVCLWEGVTVASKPQWKDFLPGRHKDETTLHKLTHLWPYSILNTHTFRPDPLQATPLKCHERLLIFSISLKKTFVTICEYCVMCVKAAVRNVCLSIEVCLKHTFADFFSQFFNSTELQYKNATKKYTFSRQCHSMSLSICHPLIK